MNSYELKNIFQPVIHGKISVPVNGVDSTNKEGVECPKPYVKFEIDGKWCCHKNEGEKDDVNGFIPDCVPDKKKPLSPPDQNQNKSKCFSDSGKLLKCKDPTKVYYLKQYTCCCK